ncbi:MAG: RDD family protein, partial [Planctomycetota bacterium]
FEDSWNYSGKYNFAWTPVIALHSEDKIYLYGCEEKTTGLILREAVVQGAVANQTDFNFPLNSLVEISGCAMGNERYVFYREENDASPAYIIFRGEEKEVVRNKIGDMFSFSAASDGEKIFLFGSPRVDKDKHSARLVYYTIKGDDVKGSYEWSHNLYDPIFGRKREIAESSAASINNQIFVCIRGSDEIAVSRFEGVEGDFKQVARMPLSARIAVWVWLGSVLAVCLALVVLGVILLRRKKIDKEDEAPIKKVKHAQIIKRGLAFAIDLSIMLVIFFITSAPIAEKNGYSLIQLLHLDNTILLKFIALGYFAMFEFLFGQTIGKKITGIIVRLEDGKKLGLWSAVLRNLFKMVYFVILIECVVALHTRYAQRLGDITAGTVVVIKAK